MPNSQETLWNRSFILVIVINFLVFMNHLIVLATFPFYIEYLGGTEAAAGLAAALFSVVAVLVRPFVGWLLNNGKRKGLVLIGLCGIFLMPIGYLMLAALYLAFICRMLHGAAFSFANTSVSTVATDMVPKSRFAEGMGMFGVATALATACAPALGLTVMKYFGFTALFLLAAGCVLVSLLLLLILRPQEVVVEHKALDLKSLADKDAIPASLTALVFLMTYGALENFAAKFAAVQGLPSGGIFFGVMAAAVFATRMITGKVTDRHGEQFFAYGCNLSMMAAFLLLGLVPCTATYLLSAVLAGFGFGGLEPALQSMAVSIAPPERRGGANSTFLCAYDIGFGVGSGIAGLLISRLSYSSMFLIMPVCNLLSILVYFLFGRNHPTSFTYRKKHGM